MSLDLNRRQLLLAAPRRGWALPAMARAMAPQPKAGTKKVLFFTKSSGFQHSVIAQSRRRAVATPRRSFPTSPRRPASRSWHPRMGGCSSPTRSASGTSLCLRRPATLPHPEATRHPPISADGEKAFYDAIRAGKGFMGMHCATDTFGHFATRNKGAEDPYIQMIGGEFIIHGAQQKSKIAIADPEFPGIKTGFGKEGKSFKINDEWYALKHLPDDLHVILYQVTEGMKGDMYQRPNFPMTWARPYGKGRVFYTSMGHREDVWSNPMYQALLLGALGMVVGPRRSQHRAQFPEGDPEGQRAANAALSRACSKPDEQLVASRGTS